MYRDPRAGAQSFGGNQGGASSPMPQRPSAMGAPTRTEGVQQPSDYFGSMLNFNLQRSGGQAPMTQADIRERAWQNLLSNQEFQRWLERTGVGQQLFKTDNENRFNFMRDLLPGILSGVGQLGGAALTGGLSTIKPK